MSDLPACPICTVQDAVESPTHYECNVCGHEWAKDVVEGDEDDAPRVVKDAHGNVLNDGDDVILVKDLKLKGSSSTIKGGTKIKNIRLVDGDHEVDCKVQGMPVMLKACFLKKS